MNFLPTFSCRVVQIPNTSPHATCQHTVRASLHAMCRHTVCATPYAMCQHTVHASLHAFCRHSLVPRLSSARMQYCTLTFEQDQRAILHARGGEPGDEATVGIQYVLHHMPCVSIQYMLHHIPYFSIQMCCTTCHVSASSRLTYPISLQPPSMSHNGCISSTIYTPVLYPSLHVYAQSCYHAYSYNMHGLSYTPSTAQYVTYWLHFLYPYTPVLYSSFHIEFPQTVMHFLVFLLTRTDVHS